MGKIFLISAVLTGLVASTPALSNPSQATHDAVSNTARSAEDRQRDASRKPQAVMDFFGVKPGMQVLDLFAGGGYYTELLAYAVGEAGAVVSHNNQAYLDYAKDQIAVRYADKRLPNVNALHQEVAELDLPAGSFDAAFLILSYHDIYYLPKDGSWARIDGPKMLEEIFTGLKPGGVLGVVDHAAVKGAPSSTGNTLHRIAPELVKREITAAGFVFDAASEVLYNPADDLKNPMYAEGIKGNTNRFVFRFKKPD
jgi:predicted methyltransferase